MRKTDIVAIINEAYANKSPLHPQSPEMLGLFQHLNNLPDTALTHADIRQLSDFIRAAMDRSEPPLDAVIRELFSKIKLNIDLSINLTLTITKQPWVLNLPPISGEFAHISTAFKPPSLLDLPPLLSDEFAQRHRRLAYASQLAQQVISQPAPINLNTLIQPNSTAIVPSAMPYNTELLQRLRSNDASLTMLVLYNCGLTDANMVALADALHRNTHVKAIFLDHNLIGDEGAKVLAQLTTLEKLSLRSNKLTETGANYFLASRRLKYLNIEDNTLEPTTTAQFMETFTKRPNRRFDWGTEFSFFARQSSKATYPRDVTVVVQADNTSQTKNNR